MFGPPDGQTKHVEVDGLLLRVGRAQSLCQRKQHKKRSNRQGDAKHVNEQQQSHQNGHHLEQLFLHGAELVNPNPHLRQPLHPRMDGKNGFFVSF